MNISNKNCTVQDCNSKYYAKDFCMYHYGLTRRGYDPHTWSGPSQRGSRRYIRECRVDGNLCHVPLSDGREALVDAEDYDLVKDFNWAPINAITKRSYVSTNIPTDEFWSSGKKKYYTLYLHRKIMSQYHNIEGLVVDHRNYDSLDNRKENLRVTTQSINSLNRSKLNSTNTSGYRGVHWDNQVMKWRTAIRWNGPQQINRTWYGTHDDPAVAAVVWDIAAIRTYGDDILAQSLNFPKRYKEYKAILRYILK